MPESSTIFQIPVERLIAHPLNPNRMSGANFEKLKSHIARSGNYEPIIVRAHPDIDSAFEIINGHHRLKALRQLNRQMADCIEWDVDDDETMLLLTTLNRLGGVDELSTKSELIQTLSQKYSSKALAGMLPDTKEVIEKLKDITKPIADIAQDSKAFLNTFVFCLDDAQAGILNQALEAALKPDKSKTFAQRKTDALTKIADCFIQRSENANSKSEEN